MLTMYSYRDRPRAAVVLPGHLLEGGAARSPRPKRIRQRGGAGVCSQAMKSAWARAAVAGSNRNFESFDLTRSSKAWVTPGKVTLSIVEPALRARSMSGWQ